MQNLTDVKYGIALNGYLVKCRRVSNRHANAVEETIIIDEYGGETWLVDDLKTVLAVARSDYKSPEWWNADYQNPIVKIDLSTGKLIQVVTTTLYLDVQEEIDG